MIIARWRVLSFSCSTRGGVHFFSRERWCSFFSVSQVVGGGDFFFLLAAPRVVCLSSACPKRRAQKSGLHPEGPQPQAVLWFVPLRASETVSVLFRFAVSDSVNTTWFVPHRASEMGSVLFRFAVSRCANKAWFVPLQASEIGPVTCWLAVLRLCPDGLVVPLGAPENRACNVQVLLFQVLPLRPGSCSPGASVAPHDFPTGNGSPVHLGVALMQLASLTRDRSPVHSSEFVSAGRSPTRTHWASVRHVCRWVSAWCVRK